LCFGLLLELVGKQGLKLHRLIDALSTAPAKIAGIPAPSIREGRRAELVLVAPEAEWVPSMTKLESKSRNSPFLGRTLKGRVLLTLADGAVAFDGLKAGAR